MLRTVADAVCNGLTKLLVEERQHDSELDAGEFLVVQNNVFGLSIFYSWNRLFL